MSLSSWWNGSFQVPLVHSTPPGVHSTRRSVQCPGVQVSGANRAHRKGARVVSTRQGDHGDMKLVPWTGPMDLTT